MPRLDGIEATRQIVAERRDGGRRATPTRIIILTTFDLDEYVYAALSAGASGFLLKDVTPEHLVAAVQLVRTGDALLAPSITRRLVERFAAARAAAAARGVPGVPARCLPPARPGCDTVRADPQRTRSPRPDRPRHVERRDRGRRCSSARRR